MSILLVDDERYILKGLSRLLGARGLEVRTASSGAEALEKMQESPPEVVLSDIRMPDMDGLELLRAVRMRFPGIPFVLMTGYGDTNIAAALQHGAYDFLKKPVKLPDLLQTIERARARRRLEAEVLEEAQGLLWPAAERSEALFSPEASGECRLLVQAALEAVQRLEQGWEERAGGPREEPDECASLLAGVRAKLLRLLELHPGEETLEGEEPERGAS